MKRASIPKQSFRCAHFRALESDLFVPFERSIFIPGGDTVSLSLQVIKLFSNIVFISFVSFIVSMQHLRF